MSMQRQIATFLYDARWINLVLLIAGTVLAVSQLKYFEVDHNLLGQVDPRSEEVVRIRELERTFGRSDSVIVALKAADIFTPEIIEELTRLSKVLEKLPNVESMLSLANVTTVTSGNGSAQAVRVLDAYERGEESLAELKARVLSNPGLIKLVVAMDGTAAAINLFIDEKLRTTAERDALMDSIQEELERIQVPGVQGFYTGNNPLIVDAIRSMKSDMDRYFWMTPLLMGILLVALFRRGNAVAVPLILIVMAVVWTLGAFFGLRKSLGLASSILPILISLTTLSDAIHAMSYYFTTGEGGSSNRERIINTMEHLLAACFMTSATTAIGIGSCITSEVETIRQFAFWAAFGIMMAYVLVMVGLPVLLSVFPGRRMSGTVHREAFWQWVYTYTGSGKVMILLGTFVVLGASAWATSFIRVEAQVSDSLPVDTPAMRGLSVVDEKLMGIGNLEVVIKGEPGVFEEAWALAEVREIHEFLRQIPEVTVVISPWSILRDLHAVLEEGDPSPDGIPSRRADIQDYYYMVESSASAERLVEFVVKDRSWARISARCKGLSSSEYLKYFREIEDFAGKNLDPRLKLHTTGRMKVFSKSVTVLVGSLFSSLFWSLILIAGVMVVHFRSVKIGLISLLPNVVPVLIPLGLMGVCGIPLTAATSMVSCLAVGLAVNNSIHFLARYRWELHYGFGLEEGLKRAMSRTGRAIIVASIVIAGGFTIFLLSDFAANRYFGFLLAVSMLTAPVVDLLLLPILIRLARVQ